LNEKLKAVSKAAAVKSTYAPTESVGNDWIKRHDPQTERQLVLDLKADLST